MFEIKWLRGNTYYIPMPTNIGIYRVSEDDVIIIDTGINERSGKKIYDLVTKEGWKIKAVLLTHAHTDHAGGCKFLSEEHGIKVFATQAERVFVENPDLEPSMVYGGFPCEDFRIKYMNTKPCKVSDIADFQMPEGMGMFSLPGHFADMVGYRTPDNVYFVADCVIDPKTLKNVPISYLLDVKSQLKTLEKIKELDGELCVPSHAAPTDEIAKLAEFNIENILQVNEKLLCVLKEPKTVEEIVAVLNECYGLSDSFVQIVMSSAAVRTHLSYLRHEGKAEYFFESRKMYWQTAQTL